MSVMSLRVPGAPVALVDEVWGDTYVAIPQFKGGLVVDIGAHVGCFTLLAVDHGCRVRAVEADPLLVKQLAENVEGLPVEIIRGIAGDGGMVAVRSAGLGVQTFTGGDEPSLTLAEILRDDPVDVLKVDCEGCEYPLLIGADLTQVAYLAVEVHEWRLHPNEEGLGVRADPMPATPTELFLWLGRTHDVSRRGDLMVGMRR